MEQLTKMPVSCLGNTSITLVYRLKPLGFVDLIEYQGSYQITALASSNTFDTGFFKLHPKLFPVAMGV
jgi:hypothetical protein